MDLLHRVKSLSREFSSDVISSRRHLHAHPELSYQEFRTAKYVSQQLRSFGIEPKEGVATTGVLAEIRGKNPEKKTIALRADMDALPIQETNEVPYKSTVHGVMHACGHDVHTSSLLGTAKILHAVRDAFEGTVRLLFQPGEEKNPGGASYMIRDGALKDPQPSGIIGQHVFPLLPVGKVGFREGMYMASCDEIYLRVIGKGGHGAAPDLAIDPVVIASHIIIALQQVISRNASPRQPTVLSFGRIIGEGATNVIPDHVDIAGTFRAMDEAWRESALNKIKKMAESIAGGETRAVFLGNMAQHHPSYAQIHALAQEVAKLAGASFGVLGEAANSVGAVAVGAIPGRGPLGQTAIKGLNAQQMLTVPLSAYLLLGVEVELDTHDPVTAMSSINAADFVVVMAPYKGKSLDYADVLLPIAPWTETSGTFVNTEGRVQSFAAVVKPLGETRPAWKVLRVLGNLLGLAGFDHNDSKEVLRDALGDTPTGNVQAFLSNEVSGVAPAQPQAVSGLERVAEVPIYQTDAVVRRSASLQMTQDAALPVARMHGNLIAKLGLTENGRVSVRQTASALTLKVQRDDLLPDNCVRIPSGHPLTAGLGPMFGPITAEPV